jgi:hypothetical protein
MGPIKLPQTELLLDSKQKSDRPRKSVIINTPADEELIKHKQLGFIKKLKTFHNQEIQNGKFHVHGRNVFYSPTSLYLFDKSTKFRKILVWLIEWR